MNVLNSIALNSVSLRRFFGASVAALLTVACADRLALAADGPVKMRLGTLAPKDTSFHQSLKVMAEKWRKAPGGGVDLVIYTDGTMGGEPDMIRRMRLGQLQAAMITVGGLYEIDGTVAALQKMPLVYNDLDEETYVREKLQPLLQERFMAKGFVLLAWADAGWVRFFSKTPALVPSEFKKLKMFASAGDRNHIELMQEEGYRPIPLEYTDTLTALQTGLIETVPTTPTYALAGQFYQTANHMVEAKWAPLVGGIVVSRKVWDTLSQETRTALTQAAVEAAADIQARGRKESDEAVEAMVKRGLVVHRLTPEQQAEWTAYGAQVQPKVRGKIVPAEIFDKVMKLLEEYRAAHPAAK